ncbi:Prolow-density lipoprotein receptor-related protein 1 [Halotydeus destructor]|nr:Prolow-density lipoprotein receptor-related protein 1 [Halotydeus destructor]
MRDKVRKALALAIDQLNKAKPRHPDAKSGSLQSTMDAREMDDSHKSLSSSDNDLEAMALKMAASGNDMGFDLLQRLNRLKSLMREVSSAKSLENSAMESDKGEKVAQTRRRQLGISSDTESIGVKQQDQNSTRTPCLGHTSNSSDANCTVHVNKTEEKHSHQKKTCSSWDACSQRCIQIKAKQFSFKCECESGYSLEPDGFTCKSDDPTPPYVIFSNRHEIKSVNLNTMTVRPLISGLKNTIALDFYHSPHGDMVFWTDVLDDKIYRGTIFAAALTNIEVVVESGLATAEGLAVDWIGKNLYWVESNLDQIEVAKLNGSHRRTLIAGDMESPRAIALDPRYGLMFWTDWDSEAPRIESASMSGEERRIVMHVDKKDTAWPNGLTLDYVALRVYWIDARSDSIQTVKYDGSEYKQILRGHEFITHPFAIALFGNFVYWTDWRANSVFRANKWNGKDIQMIQRAMGQPFDVQIYHPSRQPISTPEGNVTSPCGTDTNGGCSHLCLLNLNNTYRCKCPHVMKLNADNHTCISKEVVLLFSKPNEIRGVDLDKPYHNVIPPISLPKVIYAGELDFDSKTRRIYWADSQTNEVKRANLTGNMVETVIDTVIEHPHAFAIDWISRNMFVSSQEAVYSKIYACNLNGEYMLDIVDDAHQIRSLAVDPYNGLLFWADHGVEDIDHPENEEDAHIAMSSMDGTTHKVLSSQDRNRELHKPSSLTVDFGSNPPRLYWVNIGTGTVQFIDLLKLEVVTIWKDEGQSSASSLMPVALTVYHEHVLVASENDNATYLISKEDGQNRTLLRNQTQDVLHLKVYDKEVQTNGTNACSLNNGNCSHLCLPVSRDTRVCKCAISFEPDPVDSTKCVGPKEFLMFSWHYGIKGLSVEPSNLTGAQLLPPLSKVVIASRLDYSYEENLIYWVDSDDGTISRIRRDTTQLKTILHGLESIEGIAVDWIAKNVYWLDPSYDVIEVSRLNGSNRMVILSGDMEKPSSIAIHPVAGYLFFTDQGHPQRIERARLDGSERRVLVNESKQLSLITNIAVDLVDDKLYWCDSRQDSIERIGIDGTNRQVVLKGNEVIQNPVSLTVYQNWVYWVDTHYKGGSILRADKNVDEKNGSDTTMAILSHDLGDHIMDIAVYYERPTSADNPCSQYNGGCQELCFYLGDKKYRCECAHGRLASNGHSCENYDAFLMFSRVLEIDSIDINDEQNLNSPLPTISEKESMRNVIGLTFDYKTRRVIYSDIQKGSINSILFNGTGHRIVVERQGSVEGVAFDPFHNMLYWTSNSEASVSRMLFTEGAKPERIVKLSNDDKPRGIDVDSCGSRVYWTNWNTKRPSIQRAYLKGYGLESIITKDIRMPNALVLDHKLQVLYWADARLDKIERCNYDGTNRVALLADSPQHPFDLAIYGDYLFWTDWVAHAVYRADKHTGGELVMLRRNVPRPMGIVAIANDTNDCTSNPCLAANSGCSDICSVNLNKTVTCSCSEGRTLLPDGKRCVIRNSNCSSLEFECKSGECIPYELTCDGEKSCPDESDEELALCYDRRCPDDFFQCPNDKCIPMSLVCNGERNCPDKSDEINCTCTEGQFRCTDGMCIDKSFKCDNDPDCPDASDEIGCPEQDCSTHPLFWDTEQKFINCANTTACIHPDWICDDQNDCWDGSDELDCPVNKTSWPETTCPPNSFHDYKCRNGRCIPSRLMCDFVDDCDDNSDEDECAHRYCVETEFTCKNSRCIDKKRRCDGNPDCSDQSDELNCNTKTQCSEEDFHCKESKICIFKEWRCDGDIDCFDGSDERDCGYVCAKTEFKCENDMCINALWLCDGESDCGDDSDEDPARCADLACPNNRFRCHNNICIPLEKVCDGRNSCGDNSDEESSLCLKHACEPPRFNCSNHKCINPDQVCNRHDDCGDESDEKNCPPPEHPECPPNNFVCLNKKCIPIGHVCNGEDNCGDKSDEEEDLCHLGYKCHEGDVFCRNTRCVRRSLECDGHDDCNDGTDELHCSWQDQINWTAAWKALLFTGVVFIPSMIGLKYTLKAINRFRKRRGFFIHRRMDDDAANIEITNPMFGSDEFNEGIEPTEVHSSFSQPFSIEVEDKSTNFTNPVYGFQPPNADEENSTLLMNGNASSRGSSENTEDSPFDSSHPLA